MIYNLSIGPMPDPCYYNPVYCRLYEPMAYEYIIRHDYWGFTVHYGLSFVIFFIVGTMIFHLIGMFFEWYYTEKRQAERMKTLPGVYK